MVRGKESTQSTGWANDAAVLSPESLEFRDWLVEVIVECGFDRHPVTLRRNRQIYAQGERDDALYLVRKGLIGIRVRGESARTCITNTYGPGEIFGEECLRGIGERSSTAVALRDAELARVPLAAINARLAGDGVLGALIRHMTCCLRDAQAATINLLLTSAEQRLAQTLVRLAARGAPGVAAQWVAVPNLTQSELAAMVGTMRCRVGQFLKRMRTLGLVREVGGGRMLVDHAALVDYARDCHDQRGHRPAGGSRLHRGAGEDLEGHLPAPGGQDSATLQLQAEWLGDRARVALDYPPVLEDGQRSIRHYRRARAS